MFERSGLLLFDFVFIVRAAIRRVSKVIRAVLDRGGDGGNGVYGGPPLGVPVFLPTAAAAAAAPPFLTHAVAEQPCCSDLSRPRHSKQLPFI